MTTLNTSISRTWTKVAETADLDMLLTYDYPVSIEVATTTTDTAPTVVGHTLNRESAITRSVIGTGYVWARTAVGSIPATITLIISK